jgi:hypothetical protein
MFTAIAKPPSEVSFTYYSCLCRFHMVLTTLSSGTLAFLGSVSRASSAALIFYSAHSVALGYTNLHASTNHR